MFRHVGIVVDDIDKMLFFYSKILGMEIISDEVEEGPFLNEILGQDNLNARIVKLGKENKTIVELLDFNKKQNNFSKTIIKNGITHFALTVSNIESLRNNLIVNNFFTLSPPKISVNKKFKVFFCKDPEDNFLELVEIL